VSVLVGVRVMVGVWVEVGVSEVSRWAGWGAGQKRLFCWQLQGIGCGDFSRGAEQEATKSRIMKAAVILFMVIPST